MLVELSSLLETFLLPALLIDYRSEDRNKVGELNCDIGAFDRS